MRMTAPVLSLRPSSALLSALSLAMALAVICAAGASAQPAPPSGGYIGAGAGQTVFFSPSGQPFRAAGGQPYPVVTWFAQADADKDGKISQDEFLTDSVVFFKRLDTSHDGYVNSPENTVYETRVAPEITRIDPRIQQPAFRMHEVDSSIGVDQNPNDNRYIKRVQGASQYGLIDEPQPIRAADSNLDFRVSMDEWIAAGLQRFTILDTNGDGFITAEELPKTPAQRASEAPAPEDGKKGKKKRFFGND